MLWCLDGRVSQEGLGRVRWDELASYQASRLGHLRRKELEAKRTLFTKLSETVYISRRFWGPVTKNNTGVRGREEWEPGGITCRQLQ